MRREEFDHTVRAAGSVLGENEVLVIGSQAVHAWISGDLPPEAAMSVESDIVAFDDQNGEKADLIDGSIGEASMFHQTFGYYAQGVSETSAVLPSGWRKRLVRYETPTTNGVVAWCLEAHDLWIAKAVAGRPKDVGFCRALLASNAVDANTLETRLKATTNIDPTNRDRIERLIWSPQRPSGV